MSSQLTPSRTVYTAEETIAALHENVSTANVRAFVGRIVRAALDAPTFDRGPGGFMGTADLAEFLFPRDWINAQVGEMILVAANARSRLLSTLAALAAGDLVGYATQGPPELNRYRQTVRRWRWHAVDPTGENWPLRDAPNTATAPPLAARVTFLEQRLNQRDADWNALEAKLTALSQKVDGLFHHNH